MTQVIGTGDSRLLILLFFQNVTRNKKNLIIMKLIVLLRSWPVYIKGNGGINITP